MARPDKNSSIKPFFDDSAEGINQLPAFLTAPKKPNVLEEAVELVSSSFAKAGLTTGPLNIAATSDEESAGLREQDEDNKITLQRYADEIDEINKLIPQRRQPELKRLYDEIRANTNFDPLTLGDRFNQLRGFFFNDTAAIHNKVARGEVRVSDLRGDDLVNYLFGIVDTVDLATLGISTVVTGPLRLAVKAFRAGKIGEAKKLLKQADETGELEKTSDTIIKARLGRNKEGRSPEVYFGLDGGKGFLKEDKKNELFKLAEIINNTPIENLNTTLTGLARDNKLNTLITYDGKIDPVVTSSFNEKRYGPFLGIDQNKITQLNVNQKTGRYKGGPEKYIAVKEALNKFIEEGKTFTFQKDLAQKLEFSQDGFENFLARNPDLKELRAKIVTFDPTTGTGNAAKNLFKKEAAEIFTKKKDLTKLFLQTDQETNYFKQMNALREEAGIKDPVTPFGLFKDYMYDKFRSIKETTGNEKLSTIEFMNKYMGDADIDNFQKYAKLELDRNKANSLGRIRFNQLYENPQYKPYLEVLNKKTGELVPNITLLQFDKAHDIPLSVTRREGAGRLAKTGRFVGAGAEVELISPALQIYNSLQLRLDPYLNNFVNIVKNKTIKTKFEKTPARVYKKSATAQEKAARPIDENLMGILSEYGYNPDITKFNNQYEFVADATKFIDTMFKDRNIKTIVPYREGAKKSNFTFGVADTTKVSVIEKAERAAERLEDTIKYAIENNISPEDYLNKSKLPKSFNQGGEVETEQEEQSFLSKAASAVSNFIIPKAEALPLPKNFLLGDTPKLVKKTETVKQLAPPEAPLLEKRYNIFDENGNKVYQSKSIDDAQQKALRLGDFEGKEFTVKEIEVPVKVKKAKTTKPGTALVSTIVPENAIGSGNNKLFYSDLNSIINTDTGNLTIKGKTLPSKIISMSAKDWHDWFRSSGIKEGELYDSYVRSYLNKKGGFNRETGKFTNDEKISFAEIKELVDTSPSNYIQTVSYSDEAGNLKYGNSGRQEDYINGSRTERVLWVDSKDIRGDIGSLPSEISRYEGHSNMREVRTSNDFTTQQNKLEGEPYVIGWSLGSNRIGKLNNKDIVVNVADEIQSDFLQKAASLKSNIKQEIRRFINQSQNQQIGRNEGLELLYKKLENVFRPMPATYAQLKKSLDQLFASDQIFEKISKMDMDDITKESFKQLGEAAKVRDEALAVINSSIDNIDPRELFPNIPFKDQKDWVDAIVKNDVYNAAKKRFYFDESGALQINRDAPSHYAVAPAKAVKAYRGGNGVELSPDNLDRNGRMVAYDMQYGGPNLDDHTGKHFTSNVEESLNKIANAKSSKVEVGKVRFGMGSAGVDTFMIELTPDMLFPYKAYKKDGGLVKKSILYTPIVSVNELLSPIGASRW